MSKKNKNILIIVIAVVTFVALYLFVYPLLLVNDSTTCTTFGPGWHTLSEKYKNSDGEEKTKWACCPKGVKEIDNTCYIVP